MRADARRGDREQLDAHRFGQRVLLDLAATACRGRAAARRRGRPRSTCCERRAFFLGQVERDARAEAVDEPVGDLGRDDLVAQAVGADGVGMRLAHRLGEGVEQLRLDRACRPPAAASSAASCSTSLEIDSTTASSGRVRPRFSCAAADQLLARCEALDLAVEPARRFEQLDRPDMAGKRLRRRRSRRSTAPATAAGCPRARARRPRRSSAPAACCACRTTAARRASRG